MTFDELLTIFNERLRVLDDNLIAIVTATILCSKLNTDQLWICIVGPSGSGRTETVMGFSDCSEVRMISSLTENALMSGYKAHKKDTKDYSLFPKLDKKCLIVKDATTLLSMPFAYKNKVISELRDIYDGTSAKATGMDSKSYKARFSALLLSTPEIQHVTERALMSLFGERFLFYNIRPVGTEERKTEAHRILSIDHEKLNRDRERVKLAVRRFFDGFDLEDVNTTKVPHGFIDPLMLTATLRTPVARDTFHGYQVKHPPSVEFPKRLVSQVRTLYRILASFNSSTIDPKKVVYRVLWSTVPDVRRLLLEKLLNGSMKTQRAINFLGIGTMFGRCTLEDLYLLGVLDRETLAHNKYRWSLKEDKKELIGTLMGK